MQTTSKRAARTKKAKRPAVADLLKLEQRLKTLAADNGAEAATHAWHCVVHDTWEQRREAVGCQATAVTYNQAALLLRMLLDGQALPIYPPPPPEPLEPDPDPQSDAEPQTAELDEPQTQGQ